MAEEAGIVGLLLAGGQGRRMGGGDKPLLLLDGKPILAHVVARLGPQCAGLAINANGDPARFAAFGLPVVPDDQPDFAGPLAGVLAGMNYAAAHQPRATAILSAPADTPFLPQDLAARLTAGMRSARASIAVAASGGRTHHTVALWDIALREPLFRALREEGVRKVSVFIARFPSVTVDWPVTPTDPFFNVNRPEDLEIARLLLAPRPD
jgi:molybdopterin-guanine dinucleotide biosynthesis protein A